MISPTIKHLLISAFVRDGVICYRAHTNLGSSEQWEVLEGWDLVFKADSLLIGFGVSYVLTATGERFLNGVLKQESKGVK